MKTYKYLYPSSVIWTSFDGGTVQAENRLQAAIKAEAELQAALDKVNYVLRTHSDTQDIFIEMNMDCIEITEVKPKSQFAEIKTDYTDDNGVTHIDGYRTWDDCDDGTVIGYFINGDVYWRDPEYQFDSYVQEVVNELKSGK
jgi:hypothetical protein